MPAEQEPVFHGDDSDPRDLAVRAVLDDCRRRRAAGENISDEALLAAHPELSPELTEELRKLRLIAAGREQAAAPINPGGEQTIEHKSSKKDSRGLHIRCPHCSNHVELLTDTPYEEIHCSTCGSTFNLVTREEPTRMAASLKTIDRFDLVARLGIGGFGTVWKARDRELDRVVAVKLPRRGQLAPAEIEQFFREARAAAQLRHSHIVTVHEVGRDGETLFIVSDFVRGVTLADWKSGNRPNPREAVELFLPIADALQHAHEHGVIHRDLKPSNIMIDEAGQPLLTDFGLAKRDVGEITMTVEGQIMGTPAYMSPEQAGGHVHWTDRRTDIYSFGVILFELLTGELPFRGNAQLQIHKRLTEDPPDPRTLNRHIPRDLCTICLKCLERDPNRRYGSAKELADELGRFLRHEPILARPISRLERTLRWTKRNPALAAAAALTVILAIAGPTTAVVIESQRRRIVVEDEKNKNLITQMTNEHSADAIDIQHLRKSLDLWEGRANPWQLWPPTPAQNPRKILMQRVVDQGDRLTSPWLQTADDQQRAFGFLGLAIIDDELDRAVDAIAHYQAAKDLLTRLVASQPTANQYAVALADCCLQLGRLKMKDDRSAAEKEIEQARAISRQLATQNEDSRIHSAWLEAEMAAAVTGGSEAATAGQHLARAEQISKSFPPGDLKNPVQLYQLACYLGGREPILLTRTPESGAKNN